MTAPIAITPTSPRQFDPWRQGELPKLEEVRPGIFAVAMPLPNPHLRYSFCYLITDDAGGVHLIDSGLGDDRCFDVLRTALRDVDRGFADVRTITVTHLHPDHIGLAERVRSECGASVGIHAIEQDALRNPRPWTTTDFAAWGVPDAAMAERGLPLAPRQQSPFEADALLQDGDLLAVSGRALRVIHTPGHTEGHICIAGEGVLFTGDHILPDQFAGLGLGGRSSTNPVADYVGSLDRLGEFDQFEVFPGHGYRFTGLAGRIRETRAHHARRTGEVAALLEVEPDLTVWEVASRLTWTAGWDSLRDFYLVSALSQTAYHREFAGGKP